MAAHTIGARLPRIANPNNSLAVTRRIKESGGLPNSNLDDMRKHKVVRGLAQV